MAGNNSSIHRSSSRPQLDLSKAEIQGNVEDRDPTILLPNQSHDISHLSLDIGGIIIIHLHFSFIFLGPVFCFFSPLLNYYYFLFAITASQ